MIFKCNRQIEIKYEDLHLNNEKINRVNEVKFLGIIFDEKLNWNAHHNNLLQKIRKSKYIFRQCKYLDSFSKYKLYMSYVHSHLIYGITLWGPMSTNTQKIKLNNMLGSIIKQSSMVEKDMQKIFELEPTIQMYMLQYVYKLINGVLPENVKIPFETHNRNNRDNENRTNLRKEKNIKIVWRNTKIFQRSVFQKGIKIWNKLNENIQKSPSFWSFKNRLKKFYIDLDNDMTV